MAIINPAVAKRNIALLKQWCPEVENNGAEMMCMVSVKPDGRLMVLTPSYQPNEKMVEMLGIAANMIKQSTGIGQMSISGNE